MKRRLTCGGLVAVLSATSSAQWIEDFDTYTLAPLSTQSRWEQWDNQSTVDADVVTGFEFTSPHAGLIRGDVGPDPGDDVVYDFAHLAGGRPTRGSWTLSIKTFVPNGAAGDGFVILLNEYPNPKNWSLEVRFDADVGEVQNDNGPEAVSMVYGEWVSLVACIDLDADRVDVFYGDQTLATGKSWKDGASGGGSQQIAVLDLYAGQPGFGITGMGFDEVRLEETFGASCRLNVTPNPIDAGDSLGFLVDCPSLPSGTRAALFTWSVNDFPFRMRLLTFQLKAGGRWSASFTAPAGLSGVDIGLKALALPPTGPVALSNEDLLVFR